MPKLAIIAAIIFISIPNIVSAYDSDEDSQNERKNKSSKKIIEGYGFKVEKLNHLLRNSCNTGSYLQVLKNKKPRGKQTTFIIQNKFTTISFD